VKNSLAANAQFSILHQHSLFGGGDYQAHLSFAALGNESLPFRFLGLKDYFSLQRRWPLGGLRSLTGELDGHRYYTRLGEELGQGWNIKMRWEERLNVRLPVRLGVYAHYTENRLVAALPQSLKQTSQALVRVTSFLAEKGSEFGSTLNWQKGLESFWGRSDKGLFYRISMAAFYTDLNFGYRLNLVLGGSVFAGDDLTVSLAYGDVGGGLDKGGSTLIKGRYSYSFD